MILDADSVKRRLTAIWPGLRHLWLTSRAYHLPTDDDINRHVAGQAVRELAFRKGPGECEFFALQLHAAVRRQTYLDYDATWAFGQCLGTRVDFSRDRVHACNIIVQEQRICLLEPQTYQLLPVTGPIAEDDPNHIFYATL